MLNKQRRRIKHDTSFSAQFTGRLSHHLAVSSSSLVARVPRAATRRFTKQLDARYPFPLRLSSLGRLIQHHFIPASH